MFCLQQRNKGVHKIFFHVHCLHSLSLLIWHQKKGYFYITAKSKSIAFLVFYSYTFISAHSLSCTYNISPVWYVYLTSYIYLSFLPMYPSIEAHVILHFTIHNFTYLYEIKLFEHCLLHFCPFWCRNKVDRKTHHVTLSNVIAITFVSNYYASYCVSAVSVCMCWTNRWEQLCTCNAWKHIKDEQNAFRKVITHTTSASL